MFARSVLVSSALVLASVLSFAACNGGDAPDDPAPAGSLTVKGSCVDALGSTWTLVPAQATVTPGTRLHFEVDRNGAKYQSGPGAATVHYSAPDGGTLADPDGIETDYAAGEKLGDYSVSVRIANATTALCYLDGVVHVVATLPTDAGTDAGPSLPPPSTAPVPADAYHVDLSGPWGRISDANSADDPSPVVTLAGGSSSSATQTYVGKDGQSCGCNADYKVVKLDKSYDCASTTLAFDYAGSGSFGYTSNQAVSIRFCKGDTCTETPFYGGDEFKASQQSGHSNCGWEWNNTLPAPQLATGHNAIDLGKLTKGLNGSCSGSFDSINIHLQAYACYASSDQGTQTISNVVLYATPQ